MYAYYCDEEREDIFLLLHLRKDVADIKVDVSDDEEYIEDGYRVNCIRDTQGRVWLGDRMIAENVQKSCFIYGDVVGISLLMDISIDIARACLPTAPFPFPQ
eukprot:TRINITY_DN4222_c0_g1_i1.p1 TRINITY_DN4222_c0_g1~~TRINITY_DN4222_c0_g1_i1.p1  ORF type:complete len:102 (-),score=11.03 TRINITY_DN4222_c0_g1_i1:203-508(-)